LPSGKVQRPEGSAIESTLLAVVPGPFYSLWGSLSVASVFPCFDSLLRRPRLTDLPTEHGTGLESS